jgi:hypothetical protein
MCIAACALAHGSNLLPVAPNINPGDGEFLYPTKGRLGVIQNTIGSPRFVQMALHLTF